MSPKMVTGKANGKRNEKTVSDRPVTLPTREQLIAQLNEDLSRDRGAEPLTKFTIRGGVFR